MNEYVFKSLLKCSNEQMHKCTNVCSFEYTNKHFNKQTFNHSIGRLSQSLFCLSECLMVRYG